MAKQGRETRYFCFWTKRAAASGAFGARLGGTRSRRSRGAGGHGLNPQQASRFLPFLPDVGMPTTRRHAPATQRPVRRRQRLWKIGTPSSSHIAVSKVFFSSGNGASSHQSGPSV